MIMKPFLKSSALAALSAGIMAVSLPAAALARPDDDRDGGEPRGAGRHSYAQPDSAPPPAIRPPAPTPSAPPAAAWNQGLRGGNEQTMPTRQSQETASPRQSHERPPIVATDTPYRRAPEHSWTNNDARRSEDRPAAIWRGEPHRGDTYRGDNWRSRDNQAWNRDWRRNNHNDWHGWRDNHREFYHLSRYYPPYRGWTYRRLSIGFFLNTVFFGESYWISNPQMYRLPDAYGPYRWVRYYDDAVMVNIYSGEVVDVIYDFFW